MRIAGLIFIVAGIVALIYQGITYTKKRDTVQVGPIGITAEQKETIPISPVIGAALVVVGAGLLLASRRKA
jgi:hypothetical protein